jgi:hypothetical protein
MGKVLALADEKRAGSVNISGEGHRVTEGEHDRSRLALQRGSYDGWCQRGRPGDETNADSLAARRFELLIDPLAVAVPTADEAEPPARLTAAARAPPPTNAIGAEMIG